MIGRSGVLHHLPFDQGTASIVIASAPMGRYGLAQRYQIGLPICRVVLFRDGQRAEQASFFGTAAVLAWITDELGPLRLDRLRPAAGVDTQNHVAVVRAWMIRNGLLRETP